MATHTSDERRLEVADIVIDNNGSSQRTLQQVEQLWLKRILPFRDTLWRIDRPNSPRSCLPTIRSGRSAIGVP